MMSIKPNHRGVVLISILWVLTGLSMIVASSLTAVRTDMQLTQTHLRLTQARSIAEAGIYWAIYSLLKPRRTARPGLPEVSIELAWGNARVTLNIENESGKIDVNTANRRLIENALIQAGLGNSAARALTDEHERAKQTAVVSDRNRTAPLKKFQSVEDFTSILGAQLEARKRIISWLTVYNGREGINPLAARRETLLAVPGMSERMVDSYLEKRKRWPFRTPDAGFNQKYFTDRLSPVYTITAHTNIDGISSTIDSTVRFSALRDRPFQILQWRSSAGFDQG